MRRAVYPYVATVTPRLPPRCQSEGTHGTGWPSAPVTLIAMRDRSTLQGAGGVRWSISRLVECAAALGHLQLRLQTGSGASGSNQTGGSDRANEYTGRGYWGSNNYQRRSTRAAAPVARDNKAGS